MNNIDEHTFRIALWVTDGQAPYIIWLKTRYYADGLQLSRYPALLRVCTGDSRIPAATILLESWDTETSDWTFFRMTEHLSLLDGCSRLVLRIAGTGACMGLGREIAGLEESLERAAWHSSTRPTLGVMQYNV
ncbi:hypothetical protein VTO73DRAFT_9640 [Trametes versicolor]